MSSDNNHFQKQALLEKYIYFEQILFSKALAFEKLSFIMAMRYFLKNKKHLESCLFEQSCFEKRWLLKKSNVFADYTHFSFKQIWYSKKVAFVEQNSRCF